MPHLIVEYSANVASSIDIPSLLKAVHRAALDTGIFPVGGVRTRAIRHEQYVVADGHPDNGFIHVQARIGHGRSDDVRAQASEVIFAALKEATAAHMRSHAFGLSFEFVEMASVGAQKHNNLHEHVERRAKA